MTAQKRPNEERFKKKGDPKMYVMPERIDAPADEIARKALSVRGYAKRGKRK